MDPLDDAIDHVRGAAGRVIGYAGELELDVARFETDVRSDPVLERIRRDVQSGIASGQVRRTPTLFIDGVVHLGGYDAAALLEALARG